VIRIFTGYDKREAQGWQVFCRSLIDQTKEPVSIIPIGGHQRDGTNAFTYSRFLVPAMCDFSGWALWVDGSDMMMRADIGELWALRDEKYAVQVVKHDYRTKHARKYIGTPMESDNADYPRKNWSSVILWNCARNRVLSPDFVSNATGAFLHRFTWLDNDKIGELPPEWNVLVGEQEEAAKLAHFTLGIPGFKAYQDSWYSGEWRAWL